MKVDEPLDLTYHSVMTASQIMSAPAVSIAPTALISEAARLMLRRSVSSLPVLRGDQLVGIVDEASVFRAQAAQAGVPLGGTEHPQYLDVPHTVSDLMWRDVLWIGPTDSVRMCLSLMMRHHGRSLPVLRRGRLVGIVTRRDALRALNATARDRQRVLDLRDGRLSSADRPAARASAGV